MFWSFQNTLLEDSYILIQWWILGLLRFICKDKARFRHRTFHEPNLIRIKADPNYLDRLNVIQTSILIPAELNSESEKCAFRSICLQNTSYEFLHLVRDMKSSASESKAFQSRSKGEIPARARRKERLSRSKLKQAFLIDSDAELFMYLIQCIRFGSWKVRRLNRA